MELKRTKLAGREQLNNAQKNGREREREREPRGGESLSILFSNVISRRARVRSDVHFKTEMAQSVEGYVRWLKITNNNIHI